MNTSNTRDRILDSLQAILVNEGYSGVTLEAVARDASVSKGGLLYHFPSKAAMLTGLIERLSALAEEEFREAVEGGEGVVRVFLRTSLPRSPQERELYWAVIAALRGQEDLPEEATRRVQDLFSRWGELLRAEIDDPVLAEIILRAGDGLYMSAIAGLPQPDPELTRRMIDRLAEESDKVRRER
ncbi:TetR family transcriptional regulator [Nocardiopsis sp. TSRI0078]|uniref:TetR/AcrR family transcriptional regulator n=1 Tax=unclassified Nocardiopsis TaxID=2649073 RepID=UPI00093B85B1|nr:TetR/AcrR family transcriptional regulator [Nocardiopsis sp. TSRI0078]OKI15681.1 TetR family transcriptional regulator [Nocardiopsis sp. TSRI0078]